MPQITSGSNATFTVPSGYVIDVQCPGGWVQLEYPVGTKVFEGNPAGQTFGPYSGGSAKLTSVRGDIYYEVDPKTGGVDSPFDPSNVNIGGGSIGGAPVKIARVLTGFHTSRLDQNSFTGYSWQTTFCLPEKADAIRIAVPAYCTAGAASLDAMVIAPTADLNGGATTPTGAFVSVTFAGGDASVSQPASASNGKFKGVVWSDWIPIASVDRTDTVGAPPAYVMRGFVSTANAACYGNGATEPAIASSPYPLPFKTWLKLGDFVTTNQAGFTSPSSAGVSLMAGIEYVCSTVSPTLNMSEFTDSIGMGYGLTDQGIGALDMVAQSLRAGGRRAAAAIYSEAGRTTQNSFRHFASVAPSLPKGTVVIFRPYTRNSSGNTDSMRYAEAFLEVCAINGLTPVLQTGFYESATPANNTTMQSVNAATRTLAANAGVSLIELETVITSANAATYLQVDGIHPSATGRAAMASAYQGVLSLIQR